MAKLAKSKDPQNWRKGKDLKIGDMIAVKWGPDGPVEYSPIVSYDGKRPYMSVTNHVWTLENGDKLWCGGGEYAAGRFDVSS